MAQHERDGLPAADVVAAVVAEPGYRARARALRRQQGSFSPQLAEAFRAQATATVRRDPREAGALARLGLIVANAVRDPGGRVACLRALAEAHTVAGAFPAALRAVEQAIAIPREAGDVLAVADLEAIRIPILVHLERYAEAREAGRRALEVLGGDEHAARRFRVEMALAELAFRADRPREALRHLADAESHLAGRLTPRLSGVLAMNRGNALEACNRFRAAGRQFDVAREIFAADGRDHTVAQIDYNAAYAEFLRNRHESALRRYARVEEEFLRLEDDRHLAHVALDRAEIHLHMNLPADAEAFALEAERRFRKAALAKEAAQAAQHVARAAALQGDVGRAAEAYVRAGLLFAELGLGERQLACLVAQGHLAADAGRADSARQLAAAARRALDADMNPLSEAAVALLEGRLELEAGCHTEALDHVRGALQTCRHIHAPWLAVEAWGLAGRIHATRRDLPSAIHAYRQAIDELERYRGGVPPDEYMAAFLAGRAGLYAEVVDLLVRAGDSEMAFEFIERAKSRALVDLLARSTATSTGDERRHPTPRRVRYLRERLEAVYRRIARATPEPGTPAARSLREARVQACEYEQEIARLLRTHRLKDPETVSLEAVDAPSLATIRLELAEDTTLVEYFLSEQGLFTIVVDGHDTHVVKQDIREEGLRRMLERFHFHLSKYQRPQLEAEALVASATRANLSKLAAILLEPVAEHLRGKRLVIAPHGVLHHLPFHALPWGDGWLTDRFEIVYTPSAAVYTYCGRRKEASSGTPCVFGLPDEQAPEIEAEARRVAERLGSDRLHLRDEATLDRLREEARDARIVHIATHGMFRHAEPMLSSIRLADRWVNLYDLYSLEVGGELVVLSTCESGIADVTGGDEILGMARGFLYAGARALLTSQWRVHDAVTSEFMDAFYDQLEELGDAAAAHRAAMASVRAKHPHPYFWAPFFLTGRPVTSASRRAFEPRDLATRNPSLQPVCPPTGTERHST
jgi:CHAT domain-containing protein